MNPGAQRGKVKPAPVTRRQFLQWIGGAVLGATALSIGGIDYVSRIEPSWVELVRQKLTLPHLAPAFDGFRLAQISDIHLSSSMTGDRVYQVVQMVLKEKPDLVALTGDFIDDEKGIKRSVADLIEALRPFSAETQVVAVLGNHDYTVNPSAVRKILQESHIRELRNEVLSLQRGQNFLHIAGIDDVIQGNPRLSQVLKQIPAAEAASSSGSQPIDAAILLAHEPDFADSVEMAQRFDLQISGHSHGGQVVFPLVGPLVLPMLAEKYPSGLYQVGSLLQYTNRGLGTIPPRVRFNCRPEVTLFTLHSNQ